MDSRSQLVMNPIALTQTLRGLCSDDSQWVYAVYWRILPRNYPPPQWGTESGIMDRSKGSKRNWILQWEDGYCNFAACSAARNDSRGAQASTSFHSKRHNSCDVDLVQLETMNPELFFKMSHEVYNYGEGLMGKVAADSSHKWVYQEPLEHEIGFFSSPWHGTMDTHPRTWEGQFKSGIQTIAVVSVQEGVLQLGSTSKIMEDLNFVLYMQRKFNFLHTLPSAFVQHQAATSSGGASKRGIEALAPDIASTMAYKKLNVPRPNDQFLAVPGVSPESWPAVVAPITAPAKKRSRRSSASSEPANNVPIKHAHLVGGRGVNRCTQEGRTSFKAFHPEIYSTPVNFVSSAMSSLQALLSKLPSVTGPMVDNNWRCSYSRTAGFEVINCGGFADFKSNHALPTLSSNSSHGLHRMVDRDCIDIGPTDYSNAAGNHVLEDPEVQPHNYKNGANHDVLESPEVQPHNYKNGANHHVLEDAVDQVQPQISNRNGANHVLEADVEVQPQNDRNMVAKENHTKHNSMFDTFEHFAELDALESGDCSYTSFLNQICS